MGWALEQVQASEALSLGLCRRRCGPRACLLSSFTWRPPSSPSVCRHFQCIPCLSEDMARDAAFFFPCCLSFPTACSRASLADAQGCGLLSGGLTSSPPLSSPLLPGGLPACPSPSHSASFPLKAEEGARRPSDSQCRSLGLLTGLCAQ